jgi:glycosyltransferase involved in cell wall biosynthesis
MSQRNQQSFHAVRAIHITSVHGPFDVRIFHKQCRALARAGYEVIELTNGEADAFSAGVHIRGLGPSRGRLHRVTTKMLTMCRQAMGLNADVYHIHDPELLPLGLLLRARGKCVIYDIHEDLPRTMSYKDYIPYPLRAPLMHVVESLENAAAKRMSGLVAATPAIANRFRSVHHNVAVVSNFPILSELALASGGEWSKRRRSVVYVGGISEARGIDGLLAAMDQLPDTQTKLEIAGWFSDAAQEAKLMRGTAWRHVTWHGLLDRRGIAALLGSVRVGMVVLRPEQNFIVSQPIKLFEYMAAGLPVIASDFPLWRRIVAEAGCGILVDPCDPSAIANAISYLLTHDSEAEAMGKRGRAAVELHYNWDREECTLLNFYASLFQLKCENIPVSN